MKRIKATLNVVRFYSMGYFLPRITHYAFPEWLDTKVLQQMEILLAIVTLNKGTDWRKEEVIWHSRTLPSPVRVTETQGTKNVSQTVFHHQSFLSNWSTGQRFRVSVIQSSVSKVRFGVMSLFYKNNVRL